MVLAQEARKHQSSVGSSWLGCPGSNVQRELKVIGNCDYTVTLQEQVGLFRFSPKIHPERILRTRNVSILANDGVSVAH